MKPSELGRWARTVAGLHPLQVVARPAQRVISTLLHAVPSGRGPTVRSDWPAPEPALVALVESERERARERLERLPRASLLRDFEESYGLDLGPEIQCWNTRVAVHPAPASQRARSLAVAVRLGRSDFGRELTRAARAVCLQPEVHLLGNHLLDNGLSLLSAAAVTTGPESRLWESVGRAIVDWQLTVQFGADGGHTEGSASYHLALTANLLTVLALTRAAGVILPETYVDTARRALGWCAAVRAPDGTVPLFNDCALDASPTVDTVLSLGDALGVHTVKIDSFERDSQRVKRIEPTGWVIAKVGRAMLALKAGRDGDTVQPGHVHADALSFELWVDGERVVVDAGVASYESGAMRQWCRSTAAHNTVQVEGGDTSEVWSAFRVGRRCTAKVLKVTDGVEGVTVSAAHDGWRYLPGKPVHTREVCLTEESLTVTDRVDGTFTVAEARLRVDAQAVRKVSVTGEEMRSLGVRDGWFAEHGVARPAVVFTQTLKPGCESKAVVRW